MEVDENNPPNQNAARTVQSPENEPLEEQVYSNSPQGQQGIVRDPLFVIQKQNAREVYPILKALMFRDHCTLTVGHEGLRIAVDDLHNQLGSAYIKYDQFSEYSLNAPDEVNVRVPMANLAETLNVFSGNTTVMRMTYASLGEPLVVFMEDEGLVFKSTLGTQLPQAILDFEFNQAFVMCKVVMNPQPVRDIIRDFDQSSSTVLIQVTRNYISFYTNGDLGRVKTQICVNSEQVELIECVEERVEYYYRMILIRRMLHCFSLSNKVSFRIDRRGVLSVQFLIPQSDQQTVFIEFFCNPESETYYD